MSFLRNASAINFGTVLSSGTPVSLTDISVVLVDSGTEYLVFTGALSTPRTLVTDDPITIPINDLVIEFPAGELQNAFMKRMVDETIAGNNFTIRLGTSSMGNAGTDNQPASSGGSDTGYDPATGVTLTSALT